MQVWPRAVGGCQSRNWSEQYGGGRASASSLPLPGSPSSGATQVSGPARAERQAACVGASEDAGSQPLDAWYGTSFQRYWINTIYNIISFLCKYFMTLLKIFFTFNNYKVHWIYVHPHLMVPSQMWMNKNLN